MVDSWFVAVSAIVVTLTVAVAIWTVWRMRAARRRLERMHAAAHHPSRRLVEVLYLLRSTRTGQLLLVVDVRTGQDAAVWLPFHPLGPGDVALLVWMDLQWVLMDRLPVRRPHRDVAACPPLLCGDARDRTRPPWTLRGGGSVVREGGRYPRHS